MFFLQCFSILRRERVCLDHWHCNVIEMTSDDDRLVFFSDKVDDKLDSNSDLRKTPLISHQKKIYADLKLLNRRLQKLDSDVIHYKSLLKTRLFREDGSYEKSEGPAEADIHGWLRQEIRDEMKVFHFYQNYSLKSLCQEYCCYTTCCKNCYQSCCN